MWTIKPYPGIKGLYIRTKDNKTIITGKAMYYVTIEEDKDQYTIVYRPKMDCERIYHVSGSLPLRELVSLLEGKYNVNGGLEESNDD